MHQPHSPASPDNLVFLHGMFGKPWHWQACADRMASSWKILNPVLPLLEIKADSRAIISLGDHVVRSMDAAGMDRAVLAGNSLGGHIAARMALHHPDRVAGLVLTGSSGLFERGISTIPRRPTAPWIRLKMGEVFHDTVHVTDELVTEMFEFLSNMRRVLQMVRIARCAKRDVLRDLLPGINCPVQLIWGEYDEVTPPAVGQEFHELLPNSELHMIKQCGHVAMVERPEIFNDLVAPFLARITAKRPFSSPKQPAVTESFFEPVCA